MTEPPEPPHLIETTVRVATWNVWANFGDWRERYAAIAAELAHVEPDIVCLQEAWRAADYDAPAALAAALGFHQASAIQWFEPMQIESGTAVLSRWPIANADVLRVPDPEGSSGALFQAIKIEGPRRSVHVFNAMLPWRPDESHVRVRQVTAFGEWLASRNIRGAAVVLCGDFNAPPDSDELRLLKGLTRPIAPGLVFYDAWDLCNPGDPGFTWTRSNPHTHRAPLPDRRIDHILSLWGRRQGLGQPVSCERIGVERTAGGLPPSDHYGLAAELRY